MIHKFTDIHPDAKIGKNVTIEAFSSISGNVTIGEGTWIGPNVSIMDGAVIGKNCQVFPGAVISAIPQDMKYQGEKTTVRIGDNTIIREFVTINKGTNAKIETSIGNNTLIMAYAHVAHDCKIGNNCILVNYVGLAGEVEIDDYAILAGGTLVHQFVRIGKHVMIGGAAKVRIDVPPYIKADRDPLSYVGVNSIGLRRRGFSNEKINEIQEIYRELYSNKQNNSKALERIKDSHMESVERNDIISYFKGSTRGVIRSSVH
jgi:UDP-N-acetylglucosamine acyltransferase